LLWFLIENGDVLAAGNQLSGSNQSRKTGTDDDRIGQPESSIRFRM
jgi:hypothetical protein